MFLKIYRKRTEEELDIIIIIKENRSQSPCQTITHPCKPISKQSIKIPPKINVCNINIEIERERRNVGSHCVRMSNSSGLRLCSVL